MGNFSPLKHERSLMIQITLNVSEELGKQLEQLPENLLVNALQQLVDDETPLEEPLKKQSSREGIREALMQVRPANPFKDIEDPVEWQREVRKDGKLPYR